MCLLRHSAKGRRLDPPLQALPAHGASAAGQRSAAQPRVQGLQRPGQGRAPADAGGAGLRGGRQHLRRRLQPGAPRDA